MLLAIVVTPEFILCFQICDKCDKKGYILSRGFRGGSEPIRQIVFFNFAKRYIAIRESKWGSPKYFLSHKHLKLKLRVFSTGYTVTMVTHYAIKLTMIGSLMFGYLSDTNIVKSHDEQR